MTDPATGSAGAAQASAGRSGADEQSAPEGPVIRDKRRIDPQTGAVRGAGGPAAAATVSASPQAGGTPNKEEAAMAAPDEKDTRVDDPAQTAAAAGEDAGQPTAASTTAGEPDGEGEVAAYSSSEDNPAEQPAGGSVAEQPAESSAVAEDVSPDATLAEDLRRDLQRLNAEYVNYKRRVDRDRELHRDLAVSGVVEALLPVLDDIHLARQHGDLEEGPFAAIAEKLEATLQRFGVARYGEAGEPFDPNVHEALMHTEAELPEGTEATTVVQVLQPGYRMNDRVVRPARVAVADPS